MGQLATSIAHEVNQPLCAMISNAQAAQRLLAAARPDLRDVREALTEIVSDGRRASEVIGRTHDMLKRQSASFSTQDVNDLIRRVKPELENHAMIRHVRLEANLSEGLPSVLAYGVQIQQVVINLVMNAIDAIDERQRTAGKVLISTEFARTDSAIIVRVADNGVGLEVEKIEKLFEPFYTSKPSGLGMGLAISRTIAETHGGRIWALTNESGGATFCLAIPARDVAGAA